MNWFEILTGFTEDSYASVQDRLQVEGDELVSTVNGKRYGIGSLTLPTLAELRGRVNASRGQRTTVSALVGDARALHSEKAFEGALFQVASQFNLLEMPSQHVTPSMASPATSTTTLRGRRAHWLPVRRRSIATIWCRAVTASGRRPRVSSMHWLAWVRRSPNGRAWRSRTCGR